ncbi:MAG: prephenate dehydrogenase [Clostridium sp.]|nr:prephenate dehydrogenase [Clostridium sp.]
MKKTVVVAGLGLMGGSMAMAFKEHTDWTVCGWNRTRAVAEKALEQGVIDAIADEETIARCDLLIPVLYPAATIDFLKRIIPTMKPGARIVDLVGVKTSVIDELEPVALAAGVHYTGGHPMAGKEVAGFDNADADLYRGASMILVPTASTAPGDVDWLSELFIQLGFGMVKICDKYEHDRMIAHTSQLCHVVSNCYVKSPSSPNHKGFSAGSYRDMIRVAGVNEVLWTDLFLTNRDALLEELDIFVSDLLKVRNALATRDEEEMKRLLKQGRLIREKIVE